MKVLYGKSQDSYKNAGPGSSLEANHGIGLFRVNIPKYADDFEEVPFGVFEEWNKKQWDRLQKYFSKDGKRLPCIFSDDSHAFVLKGVAKNHPDGIITSRTYLVWDPGRKANAVNVERISAYLRTK